jgi:hypothetical protein
MNNITVECNGFTKTNYKILTLMTLLMCLWLQVMARFSYIIAYPKNFSATDWICAMHRIYL